jgi:hypothetical protein
MKIAQIANTHSAIRNPKSAIPKEVVMAHDDVLIRVVERNDVTSPFAAVDRVDYQPFGVKALKLAVRRRQAGPPLGPLWVRPQTYQTPDARSSDARLWRVYGTVDDDPDLWVVWGAGDEMGFCVHMRENHGEKTPAPLTTTEEHPIYLHLIHRPADPQQHALTSKRLTLHVVDADGELFGTAVIELTVPDTAVDPLRAVWQWDPQAGESTIRLVGAQLPRYISRWWPTRQVAYVDVDGATAAFLQQLKLVYRRDAGDGEQGELTVWHGATKLAQIGGELRLPLHDYRLCAFELFRFPDDRRLALRIYFYWANLNFALAELMAFGVHTPASAAEMQMKLNNGRFPWSKREEIPDLERFDLLFDPANLDVKHVGSDIHWKEYWSVVETGEALDARLATKRDIPGVLLQVWQTREKARPVLDPLAYGLCDRVRDKDDPSCPHRPPLGEPLQRRLARAERDTHVLCSGCQTYFNVQKDVSRAPGAKWGKHAPRLKNVDVLEDAISSEVLEG